MIITISSNIVMLRTTIAILILMILVMAMISGMRIHGLILAIAMI